MPREAEVHRHEPSTGVGRDARFTIRWHPRYGYRVSVSELVFAEVVPVHTLPEARAALIDRCAYAGAEAQRGVTAHVKPRDLLQAEAVLVEAGLIERQETTT